MRIGSKQAVMICNHVFDGAPILKVVRDEPIDEVDSGWQCHCNAADHANDTSAKFIAVEELLKMEPTLRKYIDGPVGASLVREDILGPWETGRKSEY